ncbi:MAG TPA: helix-turn-helix transcriptional regulator [Solirubrobacteraceae bacterium]|jgi:transcriptional regulator with XRE-family HTH domain
MSLADLQTDAAVLSELGRRLARHRLERNWTQVELAARAGLGQATVQRVERGDSVQLTSLVKLLRALDLLQELDLAIPARIELPIAQLERERRKGRRRARAGRHGERSGANGQDAAERAWRWGDERDSGS